MRNRKRSVTEPTWPQHPFAILHSTVQVRDPSVSPAAPRCHCSIKDATCNQTPATLRTGHTTNG